MSSFVKDMSLSNTDGSTGIYEGFANDKGQRHGTGKTTWLHGPRKGDIEFSKYVNDVRVGPMRYAIAAGEVRIATSNEQGRFNGMAVLFCLDGGKMLQKWVDGRDDLKTHADFEGIRACISDWQSSIVGAGFRLTGVHHLSIDYGTLGLSEPSKEECEAQAKFEKDLLAKTMEGATRIVQSVQDFKIVQSTGTVILYSGTLNANGLRHGRGHTRWIDGPIKGHSEMCSYHNGLRRGPCIFFWPDKRKSVGRYDDNGIEDGTAVITTPTGRQWLEIWEHGEFIEHIDDKAQIQLALAEWQAAIVQAGFTLQGEMDVVCDAPAVLMQFVD